MSQNKYNWVIEKEKRDREGEKEGEIEYIPDSAQLQCFIVIMQNRK